MCGYSHSQERGIAWLLRVISASHMCEPGQWTMRRFQLDEPLLAILRGRLQM